MDCKETLVIKEGTLEEGETHLKDIVTRVVTSRHRGQRLVTSELFRNFRKKIIGEVKDSEEGDVTHSSKEV